MDYKNGFICSILREGYDTFLRQEVDLKIFPSAVRDVLKYIDEHFQEFNVTPPLSVMRDVTNLPLVETEDEMKQPMSFWIKALRVQYSRKKLASVVKESTNKLNQHPDVAIEFIDKEIEDLKKYVHSSSCISPIFSLADVREFRANLYANKLFETPWSQFNAKLDGGFRKEELTIFAARPGVGKSMILIQMGVHSVKQGFKVLFISTEMSKEAIQQRSLYFYGGILTSYNQLKRTDLTHFAEEIIYQQVALVEEQFKDKYLLLTNTSSIAVELEDIEAKIISQKPDIVYVDGVYLLRSKSIREMDKFRRVAEIFDRLKALAKRYRCPIIVTTQLNRAQKSANGKQQNEKLDMDRVAFSDNAGMVADYMFFLVKKDKPAISEQKPEQEMIIQVGKLREGNDYDDVILNWDFKNFNFSEKPQMVNNGYR